jgi:hypothetical protein
VAVILISEEKALDSLRESKVPAGSFRRPAVVYMALILFLLFLPATLAAQDSSTFSTVLTSGTPSGNITITSDQATWEAESSGIYHLLLDKPGSSVLKGTFTLNKVPSKMYIQINHRTSTVQEISGHPTYGVYVNGQKCSNMELYFDLYTILGYDITSQCRQGQNEFSITLETTAHTSLWVRQIDISPVVSFVEQYKEKRKSENFYILIPLYLAYFFLIAITISYLVFVIMWRNNIDPQAATFLAIFLCGLGYMILPFLIFGLTLYTALISFFGLICGIAWIVRMHR